MRKEFYKDTFLALRSKKEHWRNSHGNKYKDLHFQV